MLGSAFVYDTITRVPKGEFGGCAASGGDESDGRGVRHDLVGIEEDEDVE